AFTLHGAELERDAQHGALTRRQVALEAVQMGLAVALGYDRVGQHPPDRFLARPAERPLGLLVPVDDEPAGVHRDERLVRALQDRTDQAGLLPAADLRSLRLFVQLHNAPSAPPAA